VLVEAGAGLVLENNIFFALAGESAVDLDVTPAAFTGANNLYVGAAAPSWDAQAVTLDPGFASAAAGDFHVGPTSPAGSKGVAAGISVDHDGVARPLSAPALGAYEPSK
jgi:hypothetical protein